MTNHTSAHLQHRERYIFISPPFFFCNPCLHNKIVRESITSDIVGRSSLLFANRICEICAHSIEPYNLRNAAILRFAGLVLRVMLRFMLRLPPYQGCGRLRSSVISCPVPPKTHRMIFVRTIKYSLQSNRFVLIIHIPFPMTYPTVGYQGYLPKSFLSDDV
jgi:hypothetical protein